MGGRNSKNEIFQLIGQQANEENPDSFVGATQINLTNNLIIGQSKSDPGIDYKKKNFLGEGAFASVYLVENRITESIRAMKIINKSAECTEQEEQEIINEINILRAMDHPNILKIFEFYSNKDSYSIITEYCSGGELFNEIKENGPFDEKYSAFVMYQIFSAINYCHSMKIMHRDLKPENILIMDRNRNGFPRIKICDFGTSLMVEKGGIQKKIVGSSYYIAPEVLKNNYNEKCDIWSCGVILYILLSGKPPFNGDDDNEVMANVTTGQYDLHCAPFNRISNSAKDLIKKLLIMDKDKRINAQEALNHIWFKEKKVKELYNQIKDENIIKKLLNNLKKYKRESIIQETALAYLVHNFPQMNDVINACKLFSQIDVNGDGKVTQKELYKGLKTKINSPTLEKDVAAIYKNLDMDNNGFIEYEEFVRAAVSKEKFLNDNVLRFAFRYFDKDGSGEITFDEIEDVFKKSIPEKSDIHGTLRQIIKEVDLNGDGVISFEEFAHVMKKMLK